jgi:glyoxylase-like metal-dependent hydrolase (beta-lactamase superfamily II)
MSNAGLITGRGESLLVDTLYDLRPTRAMLAGFAPLTATAPISTVVNTHGNGDHWFGNQLVAHAEIIAARGSLTDMRHVGPAEMRALTAAEGHAGRFTRRIFGRFDYSGIEPVLPHRVFDGETVLDVGGTEVRLIDVGPAHSAGDTILHVPRARTLYTGDIVFAGATPVVWHGPFTRWLTACDLLLDLDADIVVPGHGPVTTKQSVRGMRDYLEYVHEQATTRFTAGMPAMDAARDIHLGRFAELDESERLAVNVYTVYRELDPSLPPLDGPTLFGCMAELTPASDGAHPLP